MRAPVLFHLLWRLRTIGCLPIFLLGALAYFSISGMLLSAVEFAGRALEWKPRIALEDPTFGGGVALGWVFAWTIHELLSCPITATLPAFRRRLAVEALVFFAVVTALLWIAVATRDIRNSHAVASACAPVWFLGCGVGLFVANPGRFRGLFAGAAMFAGVLVAGWYSYDATRLVLAHPWTGALFAAVGASFTLAAFSAAEHRRVLSVAPDRVDGGDRDPRVLDASFRVPRRQALGAPTWTATERTHRAWARASLHDLHGATAGGWIAQALWCAVAAGVVGFLFSLPGVTRPFSPSSRSSWVSFVDGEPFWVVVVLWAVMATAWVVSLPAIPRSEFVRPWSRGQRADAVWTVCALRSAVMTGALLVLVLAVGAIAYSKALAEDRSRIATSGIPDLVAAVLILGIVAPWIAWLRLRLLDLRAVHGGFPSAIRQGVVVTAAVVASLAAAYLLGATWHAAKQVHVVLAIAVLLGAVTSSWVAFRSVLDRLFRRVDLRT